MDLKNTQPCFQFIVMNRPNTENLVENLLGDFEFELQVPYLLYRNEAQEVNGIWFYNPRECEDVAYLFTRILNAYAKIPPKPKVLIKKSKFEELEAIPSSTVIEGQLEPAFNVSTFTDVPDYPSFVNFFNTAMNVGHDTSSISSSGRMSTFLLSSRIPNAASSPAPTVQTPSLSLSSSSPTPHHDTSDPVNSSNAAANLSKRSSLLAPSSVLRTPLISPSMCDALQPRLNSQRSLGTPMPQPLPPPTPTIYLTPSSAPPANYGPLSRHQVRDALLMLVQNNQFIDIFHRAMLKVSRPGY